MITTCFFCKSNLINSKIYYVNPPGSYRKCDVCSTEEINVRFSSYVHIFYDKYNVMLDVNRNITYIFDDTSDHIAELDGLTISPSNIKDKLSTFILLS